MPPSLEVLILGVNEYNNNKFTGGIPAEWGSLTKLKELKMVACGLDGAARPIIPPSRPRAKAN